MDQLIPTTHAATDDKLAEHPCPSCGTRGWLLGVSAGRLGLADLVAAHAGAIRLAPTPLDGSRGPLVSCLHCGWNDHSAGQPN